MKSELIKLRATAEEKADVEARALAAGMTLSEFVRSKVFDSNSLRAEQPLALGTQPSLGAKAPPSNDFNVTVVDPDAARVMVDARAKQIGGPMWRARVQAIQELRAEGAIE